MIIKNIDIYPYSIPLISPLITAGETFLRREGFIISLRTNEFVGYGEIAPLPGFSSETKQHCLDAIEKIQNSISQTEIDFTINELFEIVDNHSNNIPSVKFGFETAVLDIASQMSEIFLAQYLNPNARNKIKVNALFGSSEIWDNPTVKIKIGIKPIEDELELLQMAKMKFGEQTSFRLDANGSMDFQTAVKFCNDIQYFNIDYLEQPLPRKDLDGLAELRQQTDIQIAVDESLTTLNSAQNIIDKNSADVFVIKPMVSGGFRESQKIIDIAKQHKIRTVITSSLETAIGRTAICHLIVANEITEACGLDTGHLLSRDIAEFPKINNGELYLSNSPGLGIKHININNEF
ncbi:MAG: o-succinylbenzoate synthase [Candidatus Marinimicrobia bacterium]|nr:o-succinylbenzoate synthase [Candidatus Neomarinimicrobiota bacterium]